MSSPPLSLRNATKNMASKFSQYTRISKSLDYKFTLKYSLNFNFNLILNNA